MASAAAKNPRPSGAMDVIVSPVLEALGITEKGAGAAAKKRNVAQSVNVDTLGKNFERYAGLDDDMTREEFEEFTKALPPMQPPPMPPPPMRGRPSPPPSPPPPPPPPNLTYIGGEHDARDVSLAVAHARQGPVRYGVARRVPRRAVADAELQGVVPPYPDAIAP